MFYFWLKQDQNLVLNNIDPSFFMTQVLFHMWKIVLANPSLKGTFKDEKETEAYENILKSSAFDTVMKNHTALKHMYEKALAPTKLILDLQQKNGLLKMQQIFPPYDLFLQALATQTAKLEEQDNEVQLCLNNLIFFRMLLINF
jgi:hypothetical protein